MNLSEHSYVSIPTKVAITNLDSQKRRKARLMAIIAQGLPTLPSYVFELNTLLSSDCVDLKRVAKVIRTDPGMSSQVIRMCNSALFSLRRRVLSIEEAAVLMGSERLRTLVLTCSVMEFTVRQLPPEQVQAFWQHSFVTGMLSERVAKRVGYTMCEQAYLGGLLHDIGLLPQLLVAAEESTQTNNPPDMSWRASAELEKTFFGLDHCEMGGLIGKSWNFFPSFIDVFENHHHPDRSTRDPHLVGIVAAADHFSETHTLRYAVEEGAKESMDPAPEDDFLALCFPRLDDAERADLIEMLESEYLHILPAIEFNNPGVSRTAKRMA